MSRPFKIFLIIFLLFLYYSIIPTLAFVYISESGFLKKSPLAPIVGWTILLLPFVIIIARLLIRRRKKA